MLKQLTEEEFDRRAANADRVAVFKEFLADRETPVAALSRLGDDEEAFLLESVAQVRGNADGDCSLPAPGEELLSTQT